MKREVNMDRPIEQKLCSHIMMELLTPKRLFPLTVLLIHKYSYPNSMSIRYHLEYLIERGHITKDTEGKYGPTKKRITLEVSDW
jgi:hypothetical protein